MKALRKVGEVSFKGFSLFAYGISRVFGYVSEVCEKLSDKCKVKEDVK